METDTDKGKYIPRRFAKEAISDSFNTKLNKVSIGRHTEFFAWVYK